MGAIWGFIGVITNENQLENEMDNDMETAIEGLGLGTIR